MTSRSTELFGKYRLNGRLVPIYAIPKGTTLIRGTHRVGGEWDIPPPSLRNQRVCPSEGRKADYGMLYLADNATTVAFEMGWTQAQRLPGRPMEFIDAYQPGRSRYIATHTLVCAAAFLDCDAEAIFEAFGIDLSGAIDDSRAWHALSVALFDDVRAHVGALALPMAGMTYRSRRYGAAGRCFAVFDFMRSEVLHRGQLQRLQ